MQNLDPNTNVQPKTPESTTVQIPESPEPTTSRETCFDSPILTGGLGGLALGAAVSAVELFTSLLICGLMNSHNNWYGETVCDSTGFWGPAEIAMIATPIVTTTIGCAVSFFRSRSPAPNASGETDPLLNQQPPSTGPQNA